MMLKNDLTHLNVMKMIKDHFKDELGGKIMIEFVELRAETYVCLMVDYS